jgi:hypothetical protein
MRRHRTESYFAVQPRSPFDGHAQATSQRSLREARSITASNSSVCHPPGREWSASWSINNRITWFAIILCMNCTWSSLLHQSISSLNYGVHRLSRRSGNMIASHLQEVWTRLIEPGPRTNAITILGRTRAVVVARLTDLSTLREGVGCSGLAKSLLI